MQLSSSRSVLDGYLTEKQLAEQIGVHERTLWRWRESGTGPAATFMGRRPLYRVEAVRQWLAAQEKPAPRAQRRSRSST
jgi:excisionase family DNA binding protein